MQPQLPLAPAELAILHSERTRFEEAATLASMTRIGYSYDWAMFEEWCRGMGLESIPATTDTLALYLTFMLHQGKKVSTCRRRLASIEHYHHARSLQFPASDLHRLLDGAQRLRGEQLHQMKPLSVNDLRKISRALRKDGSANALRDRALLVFGFASALRRSNLAALDLADVEFSRNGLVVQIDREKQDRTGKGRLIGIPRGRNPDSCAVRCLGAWLRVRGREDGPLFYRLTPSRYGQPLNGHCVLRIVKRAVRRVGLDPQEYGPHSLRAGFVTSAGEKSIGELLIASQTGHRSLGNLQRYFRKTNLFPVNACGLLGL